VTNISTYKLQHITTHGIYTSMYILQRRSQFTPPLVLDCPHSQRTLRTPMRKLHTLMRKCLCFRNIHITRPATCVATPTAQRDPPSITGLPRPRDAVAVAATVGTLRCHPLQMAVLGRRVNRRRWTHLIVRICVLR